VRQRQLCLRGICQAPPAGPGPVCAVNGDCDIVEKGLVCLGGARVDRTAASQCPGKVCLGTPGRCTGGEDCPSGFSQCQQINRLLDCGPNSTCILDNGPSCPADGDCTALDNTAFCLLGGCTDPCNNNTDPCRGDFAGALCVGGVCLFV